MSLWCKGEYDKRSNFCTLDCQVFGGAHKCQVEALRDLPISVWSVAIKKMVTERLQLKVKTFAQQTRVNKI